MEKKGIIALGLGALGVYLLSKSSIFSKLSIPEGWTIYQYGDDPEQQYSLNILPEHLESGKIKIIIMVHGGGMILGDFMDPSSISPGEALSSYGYSIASVDYRKLTTVNWPVPINDVQLGISTIISKLQSEFQIDDLTYYGNSAGALALALLLYSKDYPNIPLGDRFISQAGVYSPHSPHLFFKFKTQLGERISVDDILITEAKTNTPILLMEGDQDEYDSAPLTNESNLEYLAGILEPNGVHVVTKWVHGPHSGPREFTGAKDPDVINTILNFMSV